MEKVLKGERLREARREKGIRASTMGDLLGVDRNTILNYESGRREPNFATLKILLETYGLTANDVLNLPFKAA